MMPNFKKTSSADSKDFNHGKNSLNSAKSHFQQARQAVEEERLQDAATHYKQTLKHHPEHLIALQELGNVLLHLQRWSEAIPYYHKALKLEPNLPQIYHNLGDAFSHLEQWQNAIAAYREAIKIQPNYSWSYNNLADIFLKLGQWTQAAQNYQAAIQLNPDFALSHHNLGEVYRNLEQWEQAIAAYQKAVDLNPNFIWSQFHLGQLLFQHNRWNEAIHPLQKAVELQPNFEWSHYYLAEAWFNLQQWQNAIDAYRQAIEAKPDFALAYGKLADALVQQEQWSEAIVCYQKATEIDPVLNVSFYRNLELAKARINPHQADSQLVVDKYSLWPYTVPPAFTFPKTLPNGRPWPKISVITPSYNQGEFIEETILSVINQNYPNLEYILIDGGSTDDTVTVLKQYRKYFSYVVSTPDNGQSHALNKGFKRATGDIFTWLNSDDRFAPGALYAAALAFDTSGADVVAGVCQLFEGQQQVQHHLTSCKPGVMPLADILDVENCWLSGKFFYQPEVLFTRAIWQKAGGGVDESLYYSMDYEMWARFAAAGAKICPITHAIAQFRIHPAQKTNTTENYKPELLATRDQLRTRFQHQISATQRIFRPESSPKRDHLRVVLFSDLGFSGGAGLAHEQIGRALAAAGHEIMPIAGTSAWQPQPIEFSARRAIQLISCLEPDLVIVGNLHNIQDSVELLEEISAKYPTIFVMHDQWLLTGRCAYTGECQKYQSLCDRSCPTFDQYPALAPEEIQPTFERKRQLLLKTDNLLVLGNSQWTTNWARQALQSSLSAQQQNLLDKKIHKITLGIDVDIFKPRDKKSCRQRLGLPEDRFIILTGHTSLQDERKGGRYLIEALKIADIDEILVVSFGYGVPQIEGLNCEIKHTGFLQNRSILAYYYSAADLFVGASLAETLGLTFIEAAACGTPTVGYAAGGVQEAILDGVTGRLVEEKTPDTLARMITELYQDTEQLQRLSHSAPIYIASHFSIRSTYQSLIVALGEVQWLEKLQMNPICKFGVTPPQLKPSLCVKHLAETEGIDEILVGENINGCILSGFGELESPYPELNLVSSSRWALWPESQFAIESSEEKQGYLILAYRSVCIGQVLEVWAEDQLMMQTLVKADKIRQENLLTCPVTLQAGLNFFTLKMKQFTADSSSRKLGVLVEQIRFSPNLTGQKLGNGTVQGATQKVIAMDRTLTGTGWYPWETVNGVALRWMERVGSVMVDGMDVTQPLEVEVRGRTAVVPQVLNTLSLKVNGNPIPAEVEAEADGSWRLLGRVQPGILVPQEAFVLSLHSAEVYPLSSQDCRSVSVLVEEIVVEAVEVKSSQKTKILREGQYRKADQLDPNAEAYYNLGNGFLKQNQFEEAVNAYRKAIELEPQRFLYHHHLGDSFLLQEMYEEAVSPYRQAIELNSEYAWSYLNLGKALSELGKWEEAIAIYQTAVDFWPDNPDFYYGLGHAKVKLGNSEEGIVEYRRAIELRPQSISTAESQAKRQKPIEKLQKFLQLTQKRILIISRRAERIFSSQTHTELQQYFSRENYQVEFCSDVKDLDGSRFDAILLLVHLHDEISILKRLEEQGFLGLILGWFWDNHHHYYENLKVIDWVDICIPAHGFSTEIFQSADSILDEVAVPLCTTQWTREKAQNLFEKYGYQERSNSLYGGFTRYDFATKRNSIIEQVQREIPDNRVVLFDQEHEDVYFGLNLEERFAQWCGYKVSLCLPLERDLSQRFFDALLCGQIPICPGNILDLDGVLPAYTQAKLPLVKLRDYDIESVKFAYNEAIKLFNAGGLKGIKKRHQFALNNHLLIDRIDAILNDLPRLLFVAKKQSFTSTETATPTVAHDPQMAHVEYELGQTLAKQEKWQEAIASYRRAIELNSNNPWYHSNLGLALTKQGEYKQAEMAFHCALEQVPNNAWLLTCWAEALFNQQKWQEAATAYSQAVKIDPDNFWYYGELGDAWTHLSRWNEAVEAYQKATQLHPQEDTLWGKLGFALSQLQHYSEAEAVYQRATELNSQGIEYYQGWTQALHQQGKEQEAHQVTEKQKLHEAVHTNRQLIRQNSNHVLAHKHLADALTTLEQWDEAAVAYRYALELDSSQTELYAPLAKALYEQGKWEESAEAYHQAIDHEPENICLYNSLGDALRQQGDWEKAEAAYRKVLETEPHQPWIYNSLGEILTRQQKWQQAATVYRQAVEFEQHPWLLTCLGKALAKQEQWEDALSAYQKAIELNDFWEYDALGDALYHVNRWEEAITAYQKAFELCKPGLSWSHKLSFMGWSYHDLGDRHFQNNQWSEAEAAYRQATELNSNLPWHYTALGQTLEQQGKWQAAATAHRQAAELKSQSPWCQQQPVNVLEQMADWGLVICIYTCAKYENQQQAIRDTWLKEVIKHKIPYFFVVGKPSSHSYVEGDMLYVDAPDTYEHLPHKTYKMLQYIHDCTFYSHIMKVDDDCYINLRNLLECEFHKYDYMGRIAGTEDHLDRNWHLGKTTDSTIGEYMGIHKGTWANGASGYFLNRYAMGKFLEYSDHKEIAFELYEDKMVGDLLREYNIPPYFSQKYLVGVERDDQYMDHKLGLVPWDETPYPHQSNDVVVFHSDAAPEIFDKIHQNFYSANNQNREFLKRAYYWKGYPYDDICLEKVDGKPVKLSSQDILCFLVVRNELLRLPYLIQYYREKGVDKFFVVDNHSNDGSLEYLCEQSDIYVWHTTRPYGESRWGVNWVELLLQNYGVNHWCVLVDADEILYYKDCEKVDLHQFCDILDQEKSQALSTVLIDLYSRQPIRDAKYNQGQNFLDVCSYFDQQFYTMKIANQGPHKNQTGYWGGLRQRIFQNMDGAGSNRMYCLNKVPLVKYDFSVKLYEGFHWIGNVDISSQTGCLLHFKYFSTFHEKAKEEIKRGQHWNGASEYAQYARKLDSDADLTFYDPKMSVQFENSQQFKSLGIIL